MSAPGDTALGVRLAQIETRFAIADLVSAYCIAYDDRDLLALRSLVTEDVTFRSADGLLDVAGADALMTTFDAMFETRGVSFHWTHNHIIRLDD